MNAPGRILGVARLAAILVAVGGSVAAGANDIHRGFDRVLAEHVRDGRVDYPAIAADARFAGYLEWLAKADPETFPSDRERLVFWINAYNALSIKGILDGGSPRSFFGRIGFFKGTTYEVGGRELNLYDLEHDLLIPLEEPRTHFAIVCASESCPPLRSEAYLAERLDAQLDASAKTFVNDESKNRFDRDQKVAHLSKIFDWYSDEFVNDAGSVQAYVARYVDDPELAVELREGGYEVRFLKYDWRLNGKPLSN